jgi:transcription antitermination factor NusG
MTGETPSIVQAKVIEELKARVDAQGMIRLPTIKAVQKAKAELGAKARIRSGVYSGYTGEYTGLHQGSGPRERVQILLNCSGRRTKLFIEASELENV